MKDCTFSPAITKRAKSAGRTRERAESGSDVHERLALQAKARAAKLEKAQQDALKKELEEATFTPTLSTKTAATKGRGRETDDDPDAKFQRLYNVR